MHWFTSIGLVLAVGAAAAAAPGATAARQRAAPGASAVVSSAAWASSATPGLVGPATSGSAGSAVQPVAPQRGWTWPVGPIHVLVHAFDPPGSRWGAGHRGVDLAATAGQSVLAPADGRVSFSGMVAGRPVVVVAHAGGLRSTFEPVSTTASVGQPVFRGAPVGTIAAYPGHCAPSTCLHWGVLRGDSYLDPMALLAGRVILLPMS